MKTNNKKLVGLGISLIAIAVLFVSTSVATTETNITFNVTAEEKNEVSIEINNTDFGSIRQTQTKTIESSFIANNTGLTNASLNASFTTYLGSQYGLINSPDVIPATNLELGLPGDLVHLNNTGSSVFIGNATKEAPTEFDAKLTIPDGQPLKSYQGIIDIVISFE